MVENHTVVYFYLKSVNGLAIPLQTPNSLLPTPPYAY